MNQIETTQPRLFNRSRKIEAARIVLVGIIAALYWKSIVPLPALWIAVAIGLYPLAKTGVLDLVKERKIGTELFVTFATLIAMLGQEYVAGAVLMTIILIAEFIADLNTDRARASIKALVGAVPKEATVRRDGREQTIPIDQLKVGDIVLVKAGERVPVDGRVTGGEGAVDEAAITGESVPKEKAKDADVLAGTVLQTGALDVRTEKVGGDTMFARIIKLVETAEDEQAPVQKLADRVASWLIPVVVVFLIAVYFVTHDVRKIVTLMIFTSPAELGLATPLVMIAAIARAAKSGILLKGGIYLELLAKARVIVFDKTGTLTVGEPTVSAVEVFGSNITEAEVLQLAATANRRSGHPLAKAILQFAKEKNTLLSEVGAFEVIRGRGVKATVEGKEVLVGNRALLTEAKIAVPETSEDASTHVYVAQAGRALGRLQLADAVRPSAKATIESLKKQGVARVVMLTGDNARIAKKIGSELGVDDVRADLLPEDKVTAIQELQRGGEIVAMVGDGINDAPALARADIGVAMGARGTQAALEAADVALMTDDLTKIVFARRLAERAYQTIRQNLIFGVGVVHVAGITAALLGWIGPIQAAILHLGPDVLVFINSVKLVRVRIDET